MRERKPVWKATSALYFHASHASETFILDHKLHFRTFGRVQGQHLPFGDRVTKGHR